MKFAMKTLTALGLVGATTVAIAATVVSQTEPFPQIEDNQKNIVQVPAQQISEPTVTQQNQAVNQNAIAPASTTVKQALLLQDDSRVQLKGYIVKVIR